MSSANMNLGVLALLFFSVVFTAADNAYNMTCYPSPTFSIRQSNGLYKSQTCADQDLSSGVLLCIKDPSNYDVATFTKQCNTCCQSFMLSRATTTSNNNQMIANIDYANNRCICNCCLYTKY